MRNAVLLAIALAFAGNSGGGGTVPEDRRDRVILAQYCTDFARAYCQHNGMDYEERSAATVMLSDVGRWLSNLFQPSDQVFTAGYDCRFRAKDDKGEAQEFSVGVFLAKTLDFARHTQWPRLQIIPISHVTDEANGKAGYGVFKYLK